MSFARKFGDKYGKKLIGTATKTGIDTADTASKWVVQKTAEATGDLIGNKIGDKITSLAKAKSKEKEYERQEIYILSKKDPANYWWLQIVFISYKNGIPKDYKLDRQKPSKQIRFKTSMLRSNPCNFNVTGGGWEGETLAFCEF